LSDAFSALLRALESEGAPEPDPEPPAAAEPRPRARKRVAEGLSTRSREMRELRAAGRDLAVARAALDRAILVAVDAGASFAQIGKALRVTRQTAREKILTLQNKRAARRGPRNQAKGT